MRFWQRVLQKYTSLLLLLITGVPFLNITITATSKHKADWNTDVKTKVSPFDDFWQDNEVVKPDKPATRKAAAKQVTSSTNAWANIGYQVFNKN